MIVNNLIAVLDPNQVWKIRKLVKEKCTLIPNTKEF